MVGSRTTLFIKVAPESANSNTTPSPFRFLPQNKASALCCNTTNIFLAFLLDSDGNWRGRHVFQKLNRRTSTSATSPLFFSRFNSHKRCFSYKYTTGKYDVPVVVMNYRKLKNRERYVTNFFNKSRSLDDGAATPLKF